MKRLLTSAAMLALLSAGCGGGNEAAAASGDYGQTREAVKQLISDAQARGLSLSGQQVNEYEVFIKCSSFERIYELTGKWPAVMGLELMFMIEYPPYREYFVKRAKEQAARGGLVAVTWHQRNPLRVCPRGEFYLCSQSDMTDEEFNRLLTPGTKEHALWQADVDAVVPAFRELEQAGVTLLFRPYHEMNGDWFWWGRRDRYADLWRALHDRLTEHHGLKNILWVWASDKESNDAARYYPGDDMVDFVGADIYTNDNQGPMYKTAEENVRPLSASGAFAFTEIGMLPSGSVFEEIKPSWFLLWGGEYIDKRWATTDCEGCNNAEDVARIYNLDSVLTVDELEWPKGTARFDEAARTAPPEKRCPASLL